MPTINFRNHIPGVDPRLPDLPGTLTALGVTVPRALSAAISAGRWSLPALNIEALRQNLSDASTEAEFRTAASALADAYARGEAVAAHEFDTDVKRARSQRVTIAFRAAVPAIFAGLAEQYARTDLAEMLNGIDPTTLAADFLTLSPDQAGRIQRAKESAARLAGIVGAYYETARLAGWTHLNGHGVREAEELACRLGEYDTLPEWATAVDLIQAFASDRGQYDPDIEAMRPDVARVRFSVFGPAAAVVLASGRLVLSEPRVAADRVEAWRDEHTASSTWRVPGDGRIPV